MIKSAKKKGKINKKGDILSIIVLIAVIMVVVLFFAGFQYAFNEVTEKMTGLDITVFGRNVTTTADDTFGKINSAMAGLRWVALAIFVAMVLAIFISSFLVKAHPVFFIVYILMTVVAVIFAVPVSNTYETLLSSGPLAGTLMSYGAMNYILLHLPMVIAVVGIAGAIFLFIGVTVDRDVGGSII